MEILILGSNGFLGSRLTEYIIENSNYTIHTFSRSKTFITNNDRVKHLQSSNYQRIFEEKILNNIDIIIDLAGMDYKQAMDNPIESFKYNCIRSGELYNISAQEKLKLFIFLSTVHIYKEYKGIVPNENSTILPINAYSASKVSAEYLLGELYKKHKIPLNILRLANICGYNKGTNKSTSKLLINDICRSIKDGVEVNIRSDRKTKLNVFPCRSFCKEIKSLIDCKSDNDLIIKNINADESITIEEIIDLCYESYSLYCEENIKKESRKINNSEWNKLSYKDKILWEIGMIFKSYE